MYDSEVLATNARGCRYFRPGVGCRVWSRQLRLLPAIQPNWGNTMERWRVWRSGRAALLILTIVCAIIPLAVRAPVSLADTTTVTFGTYPAVSGQLETATACNLGSGTAI